MLLPVKPLKVYPSLANTFWGRANEADMAALRKIAQENANFSYREDWLSETPEWKGVSWAGVLYNMRVKRLQLNKSQLTNLDVSSLNELTELDCSVEFALGDQR